MKTTVFDGKAVAAGIREEIKKEALEKGLRPHLAVVLVGHNPASLSYVKRKQSACRELGFGFSLHHLPESATAEEIKSKILLLNSDFLIHGIILQLPLPTHLKSDELAGLILNSKDIDGLTPNSPFIPPVALSVLHVLNESKIKIKEASVVVLGRGTTAGKPIAEALRKSGTNVFVAHSQTSLSVLNSQLSTADIVVSCVGKPGILKGEMIKEGAAVIGVGISRLPSALQSSNLQRGLPTTNYQLQTLRGDLDEASLLGKASLITPTPGGIGPLTVAFLLKNLLLASQQKQ